MRECIIFVGAPCSGKSAVGKKIADITGMKYISSGDIARSIPDIEDILNAGSFAPEQIMRSRIIDEVMKHDKVILDGFPRFMEQYDFLTRNGKFDIVGCVYIDIDLRTAEIRAARRGRNDDNSISFLVRYNKYTEVTYPMINKLRTMCTDFRQFDGNKDIDELTQEVLNWMG